MHIVPAIHRESIDKPMLFIISNLSFESDQSALAQYLSQEAVCPTIQTLEVDETDDWKQQLSAGTEVIPIFNGDEDVICHFFDYILQAGSSVLTLFIGRQKMIDAMPVAGRVGKLMSAKKLTKFANGQELLTYVKGKLDFIELAQQSQYAINVSQQVLEEGEPIPWSEIEEELNIIRDRGDMIMERKEFQLYLTSFEDLRTIPIVIGLLREQTYAAVGEGTGKGLDLDTFDRSYQQLFLVDLEAKKIVGGYRIGDCKRLIERFGLSGLYMNTLYHIDEAIKPILAQSMELGRSFIVQAYQKKQLPLFLLWNGILTFMERHDHIRYIFGMVSISRAYSDISRNLMIAYLRQHHFEPAFANYVKPRQEYHASTTMESLQNIIKVFNGELIRLDEFISEIEPQKYRLPVLIRKYINQNARFIGFNIDPDFSDCVDGLMVFDHQDLPLKTVQMLRKH